MFSKLLVSVFLAVTVFCLLTFDPCLSQVKPRISIIGGDDVAQIKQSIERNLETILLEMNRLSKGQGNLDVVRSLFSEDALKVFEQFVLQNKAYTARKEYSPQMVTRNNGQAFDVRSIGVRVQLGETESSDLQSLVFSFSRDAKVINVRAVIPNQDYQSVIAMGQSTTDSLVRGMILDFLERFRMSYNTKDIEYLEQVYSDDALIIVGTVLRQKPNSDDFSRMTLLSKNKIRLVQMTKREYLDNLKKYAFRTKSYVSVKFDSIAVIQHEKHASIYGVTCWQSWKSATYSDGGYLFLMMDFRDPNEPIIHVRSWQPTAFDDGTYVGLYDFDVVAFK